MLKRNWYRVTRATCRTRDAPRRELPARGPPHPRQPPAAARAGAGGRAPAAVRSVAAAHAPAPARVLAGGPAPAPQQRPQQPQAGPRGGQPPAPALIQHPQEALHLQKVTTLLQLRHMTSRLELNNLKSTQMFCVWSSYCQCRY